MVPEGQDNVHSLASDHILLFEGAWRDFLGGYQSKIAWCASWRPYQHQLPLHQHHENTTTGSHSRLELLVHFGLVVNDILVNILIFTCWSHRNDTLVISYVFVERLTDFIGR